MQNQREMKKIFHKHKAKSKQAEDSNSDSKSKPSASSLKKKRKRKALDANILFPKKKSKTPKIGTYESQDPR